MPAILEIPDLRRRGSPLTVAEYHRLEEFNENGRRTELIRGVVIEKPPKSARHCVLARRLYDMIEGVLSAGFLLRRYDPLTLVDSEPEPDVAVVRGFESDFFEVHPQTAELVIEVATSGAVIERAYASLYAEANVKEYWIVLGMERQVEVYRLPENGQDRDQLMFSADDTIVCSSVPGLRVRLADLLV